MGLACAAAARDGGALQALVWTAPGHERQVLLEQPASCLDPVVPTEQVALGQALFNAPDLLGGQAARAGISCASCHANGRRSEWFYLAGISAEPGSADVSSSFFSRARADGQFNPTPIPDLALPGKISRDPATGQLEKFMRGLIVEEFSGREPSGGQLAALASYVRAIRACPGQLTAPRSLASDVDLVRQSVIAARVLTERGDPAGAGVLVRSARFHLGLIDERMAGPRLVSVRAAVLAASRRLPGAAARPDLLTAWLVQFDREVLPQLQRSENRSLYNPRQLDRWLAAARKAAA